MWVIFPNNPIGNNINFRINISFFISGLLLDIPRYIIIRSPGPESSRKYDI